MGTKRKFFRPLVFAVKVICFFALIAVATFIYVCGYWENWPILDQVSGPKRFRQFISSPVPPTISNIRGGYSGFPRGSVRTQFSYKDELSPLLKEWKEVPEPAKEENLRAANFSYTKVFKKTDKLFLLLNENLKEGLLYVPAG